MARVLVAAAVDWPWYSKTLVLCNFAVFCFSALAAFSMKLLEPKHKTKRVLKQNARFALPSDWSKIA